MLPFESQKWKKNYDTKDLSKNIFQSTLQINLAHWIINMYVKCFLQKIVIYKNKLLSFMEYLEMYENSSHLFIQRIRRWKRIKTWQDMNIGFNSKPKEEERLLLNFFTGPMSWVRHYYLCLRNKTMWRRNTFAILWVLFSDKKCTRFYLHIL